MILRPQRILLLVLASFKFLNEIRSCQGSCFLANGIAGRRTSILRAERSSNPTKAESSDSGEPLPPSYPDVKNDKNNLSKDKIGRLKRDLLAVAAAYDRGFGAVPSSRDEVESIIQQLSKYNPTEDASHGIEGGTSSAPLKGCWRMVWTTAFDVLSLNASPFTTVSAIYQDINPPLAINIIDLIPRTQAILPPGVAPSSVRLNVQTRANRRGPLRVGLVFESLDVRPVEILGFRFPKEMKSNLKINFPKIPGLGGTDYSSPGYFDVLYLDEDMLIIDQNEPGGKFVLVRVATTDI